MNGVHSIRQRLTGLLLLAAAVIFLGGCATSEPDNASARPWNAPKTWETGLPSSAFEGR
jgi:hypothetical protein